jgi:hypothetical protein
LDWLLILGKSLGDNFWFLGTRTRASEAFDWLLKSGKSLGDNLWFVGTRTTASEAFDWLLISGKSLGDNLWDWHAQINYQMNIRPIILYFSNEKENVRPLKKRFHFLI